MRDNVQQDAHHLLPTTKPRTQLRAARLFISRAGVARIGTIDGRRRYRRSHRAAAGLLAAGYL